MDTHVLTDKFSEPLNGATAARLDIQVGDGNLTIDRLGDGEGVLASGTLQYFESQGLPIRSLVSVDSRATLTLSAGSSKRPRFRLPWATCNGATEWQIHINPTVLFDITAHSGGGNVKLNLTGMIVDRLSAETGGGNMDVILPDNTADLDVAARTGAGNVTVEIGTGTMGNNNVNASSGAGDVIVRVPSGLAARILATTGLGKTIMDPQFSEIDKHTYQSPDFESAANKVEITAKSGAGNVIISAK